MKMTELLPLKVYPFTLKSNCSILQTMKIIISAVPSFRIFNVVDCTCTNCSTSRSVFTYSKIPILRPPYRLAQCGLISEMVLLPNTIS